MLNIRLPIPYFLEKKFCRNYKPNLAWNKYKLLKTETKRLCRSERSEESPESWEIFIASGMTAHL
ncbi:hypothetical protein [Legionella lansingensis]|uniref:hypothetical protein n=1 Tax=Legionella lansingensis TaxID=45067 RepID=UPI0004918253|nr:hypothetical protein [Legionella lansingensis]